MEYVGENTKQNSYNGERGYYGNGVDLTPNIFMDEKDRAEITDVINDFYQKFFKGLSNNDKSLISDVKASDKVKNNHDNFFQE